ncbi:MAG TPA: peptidylprolyl isomerase, partial [Candidatus Acidoferrales bacterium]|nr:peptidylprolyl isomerase [Candidatus Acidoferrales bacterium]
MSYLRTICCVIAFTALLGPANAGTLVQFRTVFGDMEVELYDQDKPVTVQNFLNYLKNGRYQNEFAHRLIPGFVLQGGGYTLVSNAIAPIPAFPPITNEFGVGRQFSNIFGTIAMAKLGGDTNSATSQWYLNLTNNAFLDAPDTNDFFVVFGHVIAGTNVLNIFNTFQNYTGTQQSNLVADLSGYFGGSFTTCPLLYPAIAQTNFLFVDISLLQVTITSVSGGGKQISWNSAKGLTNIVEYTTNLPPIWNALVTTNGTGASMTVV